MLLSDDLVKYDTVFEQSVNKLADMLNTLLRGQQANLQDQLLVNDSEFRCTSPEKYAFNNTAI